MERAKFPKVMHNLVNFPTVVWQVLVLPVPIPYLSVNSAFCLSLPKLISCQEDVIQFLEQYSASEESKVVQLVAAGVDVNTIGKVMRL